MKIRLQAGETQAARGIVVTSPKIQAPAHQGHTAHAAWRALVTTALETLRLSQENPTFGRIRGTGPGVSFGAFVQAMEREHPVVLLSPFEGSDLVAGGVWDPRTVSGDRSGSAGIAKLRWSPGADDLPMHVHDHSDRFIIVLEGRGFFHWSEQSPEAFDGRGVRTIAARERDVFVFKRGLVHTFSTAEHAMTLLSVQCPFIPFDAPDQYRLPSTPWTRRDAGNCDSACIVCELHAPGHMLPVLGQV